MKGHKEHHHKRHHEDHERHHENVAHKMHHLAGHAIKHDGKAIGAESPLEGDWDEDKSPTDIFAGANSPVIKEAKQRKHGGGVKKYKHHVGKAEGHHAEHRGDRKPRKSGGRSDQNPLSSANAGTPPKGRGGNKDFEPERDK